MMIHPDGSVFTDYYSLSLSLSLLQRPALNTGWVFIHMTWRGGAKRKKIQFGSSEVDYEVMHACMHAMQAVIDANARGRHFELVMVRPSSPSLSWCGSTYIAIAAPLCNVKVNSVDRSINGRIDPRSLLYVMTTFVDGIEALRHHI